MNYKGFHQLTWNDRLTIEKMLKVGDSKATIAKALGVSERTIYNEIKRGRASPNENYSPAVAERKYREQLKNKGADCKIRQDDALISYIEELILQKHLSPEAVIEIIKAEGKFSTDICRSTLYNYVYRGDVFPNLRPEHLYQKGSLRNKTTYPACFYKRENGYSVVFPDLHDLTSCGETFEEALMQAENDLAFYCYTCQADGNTLPPPSHLRDMDTRAVAKRALGDEAPAEEFVNLVFVNVGKYAKKHFENEKPVDVTLKIPAWLKAAALEQNINFSQLLQETLRKKLNL